MKNISTYLVWCRKTGQTRVEHDTYESALDEAKRLAESHPGDEFYVLKSLVVAKKMTVTIKELYDVGDPRADDGIPF